MNCFYEEASEWRTLKLRWRLFCRSCLLNKYMWCRSEGRGQRQTKKQANDRTFWV